MSRTALITGGAGGIGFGVTRVLLDAGWSVIATGISQAELDACPDRPQLAKAVLDVTDQSSVDRLFAGLDRLDGLVNCAGILLKAAEFDIDGFQKVIDVNLTGTMRLCLAARALLAEGGGAIVNTGSMYSYFGGGHAPAYTASKGGVAQLTKSLAVAWAKDNVRVNAIAPGWIETAMTEGARADKAREAAIIDRTPMERWGQPEEVGELVAWLLSDKARFVTGALVPVDGGYSAA